MSSLGNFILIESELQQAISEIEAKFGDSERTVDMVKIVPKSNSITQKAYGLLWLSYRQNELGKMSPDW